MQSRLGHHIVWYVLLNILEEHFEPVFTGCQEMKTVRSDHNVGTYQ